jgi:hypothetical protein
MSDDTQKKLDAAIARIATLESELRGKKASASTTIDPNELVRDPLGAMKRAGVPLDHITKIIVAQAMGDQAPQQLREYVAMSQYTSAAQQALATEIQSLRQRVDAYEARDRQDAARKSMQALVADKQKYPTLADALERDPSIFDEELSSGGDVSAIADKLEARLSRVLGSAKPKSSTASQDNAESKDGQSNQAKASGGANASSENKGNTSERAAGQPAAGVGSATDVTPPPLPKPTAGGPLTPESAEELKQRVLRKYESQIAQAKAKAGA